MGWGIENEDPRDLWPKSAADAASRPDCEHASCSGFYYAEGDNVWLPCGCFCHDSHDSRGLARAFLNGLGIIAAVAVVLFLVIAGWQAFT